MIGHNQASFDAIVEENLRRGILLVRLHTLERCIKDPRLEQRHRLVLVALSECTNKDTGMAYPGRAWLAANIVFYVSGEPRRYSVGTIANTLSELAEFGYLMMKRRAPTGGGRALAHYAVTPPPLEELQAKIAEACALIRANPKRPFPGADVTTGNDVKTGVDLSPDVTTGDDVRTPKTPENGGFTRADVKTGVDVNTGDDIREADVNFLAADVKTRLGQELVIGTSSKLSAAPDAAPRKAASTSRGTRLPADWVLSAECLDWTRSNFRVTDHKLQTELANFGDYWRSKAGSGATKLDWDATWRTWARKAFERFAAPAPQTAEARLSVATAMPPNWWLNADAVSAIGEAGWRQLIKAHGSQTWPIETLGPAPGTQGCVVPIEVQRELQLNQGGAQG